MGAIGLLCGNQNWSEGIITCTKVAVVLFLLRGNDSIKDMLLGLRQFSGWKEARQFRRNGSL